MDAGVLSHCTDRPSATVEFAHQNFITEQAAFSICIHDPFLISHSTFIRRSTCRANSAISRRSSHKTFLCQRRNSSSLLPTKARVSGLRFHLATVKACREGSDNLRIGCVQSLTRQLHHLRQWTFEYPPSMLRSSLGHHVVVCGRGSSDVLAV